MERSEDKTKNIVKLTEELFEETADRITEIIETGRELKELEPEDVWAWLGAYYQMSIVCIIDILMGGTGPEPEPKSVQIARDLVEEIYNRLKEETE